MLPVTPGTRLVATSLLRDTAFEDVTIFIHQANEEGVAGFVINKLFPRRLNELVEFSNSKPIPLYDGGPVDREHLFFLHRRPELIAEGTGITNDIFFGGNFQRALVMINNGQISETDVKIFIGYCGWDNDQLTEEIAEGSWMVETAGDINKDIWK